MKKSKIFFVIIFVAAAVISCSKDNRNDNGMDLIKNSKDQPITTKSESLPRSDGDLGNPQDGVIPFIIPGANNGGNRTCAEVAAAFVSGPNPFLCGTKVDYSGSDFSSKFPSWLHVSVTDGKYVSFRMEDCGMINGKYYRVGAVIVKGSSDANVYYYPDGTFSDSGLASPINASGAPAGLSNLTFCFIECKKELPELVIAFKSYLNDGVWACTSGGPGDIDFVAYYDFVPGSSNKIFWYMNQTIPVGDIMVGNFDDDDLLEVRVNNVDMPGKLFRDAYLFVGTLEDYEDAYYTDFPYKTGVISPVSSLTFDLPF